jgi:CDP-4-dehydro-6-deoxyglucose reductase
MSFKVQVEPSGHEFPVEQGESVLDAALRHGLAFPYGCRNGFCGACKCKVVTGEVDYGDEEPGALTEQELAVGMALPCVAKASSDLVLEIKEVSATKDIPIRTLPAKIGRMEQLSPNVMGLWLKLPEGDRLQYLAGQYVNFILADGKKRAFSIANAPHDDEFLEFHIGLVRGGRFTEQVFSEMREKDLVRIEGPQGSFFLREDSDRPIIMLATGTGFGPVKAIIEHALTEGVQRPIHIYWGARTRADLYMHERALRWAREYVNVHYHPVLSRPAAEDHWEGRTGYVQDAVLADFTDVTGFEVYACGLPDMVLSARKTLVERGLDPEHCYSDAFEWAKD